MNHHPHNARLWQGLYLTLLTTLALLAGGLLLSVARPVAGQPAVRGAAPQVSASATPVCLPGWDVVPSPNGGVTYNTLAGVTSISATDVWAVGSYQTSGTTQPLTLHWDGTVWTSIPITGTGTSTNLLGVSASSTSDVWAVGTSDGSTFVEHWNGTAWSVVPSPNGGPNGNFLWGVAAVAANKVWAVGYSFDANNVQQFLTESWDGTTWTVVPVAAVGNGGYLIGVSALASDNIWAVGAYIDAGGQDQPLTLHWDGTLWNVVPLALSGQSGSFRSVTAVSTNNVWAVGSYQAVSGGAYDVLVMHWDGVFWDFIPTSFFGTVSNLQSVAAASSTDVWMVGSYSDGNTYQTLILHWDGNSLNQVASPNVGSGKNTLNGIAARAGDSWAVGLGNGNQTLTLHYHVRCLTPSPTPTATPPCSTGWGVIYSPNVLTASNTLNGVTALSPADAWAVGSSSNAAHTLTMRWNGAYWIQTASPDGGGTSNELLAVTDLAANDVWAVGYSSNPEPRTLVLHWNGINWSLVPSPNVGTMGSRLFAVAAWTNNDIWAVGSYVSPTGDEQTLIEHWNGVGWSVVASPNGDPEGSFLRGVSIITADDAWAVGYTVHHDPPTPTATATTFAGAAADAPDQQPQHGFESLLLHWDGTTWTLVDGPDLGVEDSHYLQAVAASGSNDVWAVGYIGDTAQENLILHWDGTEWSRVASPNVGTVSNNLRSVTVVGPNDAWAAGWYINGSGIKQTLLLHWDGTDWTLVLPPNVNTGNNTFYGISAAGANDIWAVGFSSGLTGPTQTLTEHYGGPCQAPTPTRTPTRTPTATATVCPVQFNDVPVGSTFYDYIRCLACRGIISGYPCGGPGEPCPGPYYRVGNDVTRGQTAKIVASSAGFSDPVPSTQQTYEDVPPAGTFWLWVEQLAGRGIISGYPCGGPFEPCVAPANRPYFRPNNPVTRGQLAKIGANAAGYTETPTGQTFEDVPPASTFYLFIERLAGRGIMSGYPCGGAGEPCVMPGNRPYFRPGGTATRGQTAKIVANTFYPNCQTPATRR